MFSSVTYGVRRRVSNLLVLLFFPLAATAQDRVDILAYGDSLTQGYGLLEQEGFVPQLRAWLAERGHNVRVVNAGVSGDTTAGGAARIDWSLTDDIDAAIVTLGGNDLLRGIEPSSARANIRTILEATQKADVSVLLVGMEAPGNYGPDYKADFDSIYPDLSQEFGTLYYESFFKALTENGDTPAELGAFMQSDGIHPNGKGVARIVEGIGPSVEALISNTK